MYGLRHKQMHGQQKGNQTIYDHEICEHKQIGMDNKVEPDHIYDHENMSINRYAKTAKGN